MSDEKSYWFFVSYAHRDAIDSPWLRDFFERLAREVGTAAGLPSHLEERDIGFIDEDGLELGDNWPDALAEALQSSKVFLCLYSRSYFKSPDCGREFEIFRSRLANYTPPPDSGPARLIIPILWEKPSRLSETLPDAVSDLQYKHSDFGDEYATLGLALLMRLERKEEVENFISELADRIVNQAERHPLPRLPNLKPLKDVSNAFITCPASPLLAVAENLTDSDIPATVPPPNISGPDVAWYVYFAGRGVDYRGKRTNVSCYGPAGGYQWKPLLPPKEETIGAITPVVAGKKGLTPAVLPLSKELVTHLQKAEDDNTIAILIVDPWSVKVESYMALMRDYDKYRFSNCAVIIVWNLLDDETVTKTAELKDGLTEAFSRNLLVADEAFRDSIQTEDELLTILGGTIDTIKGRLRTKAKPARSVPSNGGESFPNLNGTT